MVPTEILNKKNFETSLKSKWKIIMKEYAADLAIQFQKIDFVTFGLHRDHPQRESQGKFFKNLGESP